MQSRSVALIAIFGLLALFAALNWGAFTAPTSIWLGVTSIEAPLGLILLGVIALLSAMFLAYAIHLQAGALLEARRHARDLGSLREQVEKLGASAEASRTALLQRLDKMDHDFGAALERTEASMAAYIGELDERLGARRTGDGTTSAA